MRNQRKEGAASLFVRVLTKTIIQNTIVRESLAISRKRIKYLLSESERLLTLLAVAFVTRKTRP